MRKKQDQFAKFIKLNQFLLFVLTLTFYEKSFSQNNALNFDGIDDNAIINHHPSLDFSINSSFSIEAWFKTSSLGSVCLFSKMANSPPHRGYELYSDGGNIAFLMINTWTTNCIWLKTVNVFNDGLWHHCAVVYKGTPNASNVDVYVDGVIQLITITYNSLTGPTNTSNNAGIGARDNSSYAFAGSIDEVRVWNKALVSAEIINNKNCHLLGNEGGLVAYYNFNQGIAGANNFSVTNLIDLTLNNNIGTLTSFGLNGPVSNWVTSGANISGNCSQPVNIDVSNLSDQVPLLTVFPNPNNGSFILRASEDIDLQLINEMGQEIQIIQLNEINKRMFQFKDLSPGIYCLKPNSSHFNVQVKVICIR